MDELTGPNPEVGSGAGPDARDASGSSGRDDARDAIQPRPTAGPDAHNADSRPVGVDEIEAGRPDGGEQTPATPH